MGSPKAPLIAGLPDAAGLLWLWLGIGLKSFGGGRAVQLHAQGELVDRGTWIGGLGGSVVPAGKSFQPFPIPAQLLEPEGVRTVQDIEKLAFRTRPGA